MRLDRFPEEVLQLQHVKTLRLTSTSLRQLPSLARMNWLERLSLARKLIRTSSESRQTTNWLNFLSFHPVFEFWTSEVSLPLKGDTYLQEIA